MLILGIVAGVIFVALALGLMMSRRGGDTKLYESETAWNQNTLPIHDTVANSMYGGAAPIFQQPLPQPAVQPMPQPAIQPVAQPVVNPLLQDLHCHQAATSRLDHGTMAVLRPAISRPIAVLSNPSIPMAYAKVLKGRRARKHHVRGRPHRGCHQR